MKKSVLVVLLIVLVVLCEINVFAERVVLTAAVEVLEETVSISGNISSGIGKLVSIQIINPEGERIHVNQIISGENGNFCLNFKLDETDLHGQYTALIGGEDISAPIQCSFEYDPFVSPTAPIVTAEADITDMDVSIYGTISTGAGKLVSIQVMNPNEELIHVNQIRSGTNGAYLLTFRLSTTDVEGQYTVLVGGEKINTIAACSFNYTKFSENEPEQEPDDTSVERLIIFDGDSVIYKEDNSMERIYRYQFEPPTQGCYSIKVSNGFNIKVTNADGNEVYKQTDIPSGYMLSADTVYTIEILPQINNATYEIIVEKVSDKILEKNVYYVFKDPLPKLEGSIYTQIEKFKINWLAVEGSESFYNSNGCIYKNSNGVETKILENVEAMFITPTDNYLYFSDMQKNGKIFRCDKNGENLIQITDTSASWLYTYDGYLYYTDISDNRSQKSILLSE